jgi:RNA polymerase sigma-70 factor (ECF subfamily)
VESVSVVNEARELALEAEPDRLDPSTFGKLYEQHRIAVYRYLRARTRNDDDAMDLAALTFERAFGSLGRFRRHDGGVQAWLLRIARNSAIDAHRRRRATVDLAGVDNHLGRVAIEADRRASEREDVMDLVHRLPGDLGDTLMLRYAAGLTAREIGAVVGKREAAVQKQIERGLAALREAYT